MRACHRILSCRRPPRPQAAAAGGDPTIAPSFAVLTPDLLTAFAKLPSPPSSLW
jgi:hypothetical protein